MAPEAMGETAMLPAIAEAVAWWWRCRSLRGWRSCRQIRGRPESERAGADLMVDDRSVHWVHYSATLGA
jgi:hypothetical protein